MSPSDNFREIAKAYTDGVGAMFTGPGRMTGERGVRSPVSYKDLADQAESLSPIAERFNKTAVDQLNDSDSTIRIQRATSLMAKALTDLHVSAYLLQAATDEEDGLGFEELGNRQERGLPAFDQMENLFSIVRGEAESVVDKAERITRLPETIIAARLALANSVADALDLISNRASRTGQSALSGLMGLSGAELSQVVGNIGLEIAGTLSQAEKVSHLYNLFRRYVTSAVETLIALVGRPVLEWMNDLKAGGGFRQILQNLYATSETTEKLHHSITNSEASLEQFIAAIQDVDNLEDAYHKQIETAEKLLKGLRFVSNISVAVLPSGVLLLGGAYITLGIYVIAAGGDYVDAPRLQFLDRVPGVQKVVESRLAVVT